MRRNQDARLSQGEDRVLAIAVANPSASDLTAMEARYIVAPSNPGPQTALIEKADGAGIEIVTAQVPPGFDVLLNVSLTNDDTADLAPGFYYHEAAIILATGAVIVVMTGQLRLDPSWIASRL